MTSFQKKCSYCSKSTQIITEEIAPHEWKPFNLDKTPHNHILRSKQN